MLKGINPLIGPELLSLLARMGHGDELVVVDRNYPAYSAGAPVVRLDGVDAAQAIGAIASLLPFDTFVDEPLLRMEVVGAPDDVTEVQREVHEAAEGQAGRALGMGSIERHAFYARARHAFAVVATGEDRPYGCFILVKGVLPEFTP